jgi:hypothetical protein
MTPKQTSVEDGQIQAGVYRVALALDAFLVNGIQYGILSGNASGGFLEMTAGNFKRDLAELEGLLVGAKPTAKELCVALRDGCQQLIDHVEGLSSFRDLPLQSMRAAVAQVPILRSDCVRLLQETETVFQTSQLFYQSRPASSTAAVSDFLATLERAFTDKWHAAREPGEHTFDATSGTPPDGNGQPHSAVNAASGPRSSG